MIETNDKKGLYAQMRLTLNRPDTGSLKSFVPSNIGISVNGKEIPLDFTTYYASMRVSEDKTTIYVNLERLDIEDNYQDEWQQAGFSPMDLFDKKLLADAIVTEISYDAYDDNDETLQLTPDCLVLFYKDQTHTFDQSKMDLS